VVGLKAFRGRDESRTRQWPWAEIVAKCAAQCAASNRPKPGAETALFHYHPYFSGAQRPNGQWI